jgi:serine/threonine protein kinase
LAVDLSNAQALVAIKFYDSIEDFRHELGLLQALASEFVVPLVAAFEEVAGGQSCLVLERGDLTLMEHLRRGPLERSETRYIADKLARALYWLHRHVVVVPVVVRSLVCSSDSVTVPVCRMAQ